MKKMKAMKEGTEYLFTFTKDFSCEVIDQWDEEKDCVKESHDENFTIGQEMEAFVLDNFPTYVNVQLGDGGVIYGLYKEHFTAKEMK